MLLWDQSKLEIDFSCPGSLELTKWTLSFYYGIYATDDYRLAKFMRLHQC